MVVRSHDPARTVMIVGTLPITGYDAEEMIKISTKEDMWTGETDADGANFVFIKNYDAQAEITFMLKDNSICVGPLKILTDIANLTGIPIPIKIMDLNTLRSHFAGSCMLVKAPDESYGKKPGVLEYKFLAASKTTV